MMNSLPAAAIALALSIFAIPAGFPYHSNNPSKFYGLKNLVSKNTWLRVDILGSVLLFLSTLSITAGFEEAGSRFPWRSSYVISLLTVSGILWIALLLWERRVSLASKIREPVLPWRFVTDRALIGILM
jgi:formate hydrogenlyase subunit 3/multisubunit Na+/H+ antiporter MnhD subunit